MIQMDLGNLFEVPVREHNYSYTPDQRMVILFTSRDTAIRTVERIKKYQATHTSRISEII